MEIRRTFCQKSRQVQTPKNGKTRRVDMSQQLTETLKTLLVERKKETLQKGWGAVPLWVFVTETGPKLLKLYGIISRESLERPFFAV
jgi:integrase